MVYKLFSLLINKCDQNPHFSHKNNTFGACHVQLFSTRTNKKIIFYYLASKHLWLFLCHRLVHRNYLGKVEWP